MRQSLISIYCGYSCNGEIIYVIRWIRLLLLTVTFWKICKYITFDYYISTDIFCQSLSQQKFSIFLQFVCFLLKTIEWFTARNSRRVSYIHLHANIFGKSIRINLNPQIVGIVSGKYNCLSKICLMQYSLSQTELLLRSKIQFCFK